MSDWSSSDVNRRQRDILSEALRQTLEERLHPGELYEVIDALGPINDEAVKTVSDALFNFDEDYPYIVSSKAGWDEIQRWLLLLDSDYQISNRTDYIWSRWQLVAAVGFITCVLFGATEGWAAALVWLSIPSGLLSWKIAKARSIAPYHLDGIVRPFDSIDSLFETCRATKASIGFRKMRFTGKPIEKRVQTPFEKAFFTRLKRALKWSFHTAWLVFAPTVLFLPFQMLPKRHFQQRVVFQD